MWKGIYCIRVVGTGGRNHARRRSEGNQEPRIPRRASPPAPRPNMSRTAMRCWSRPAPAPASAPTTTPTAPPAPRSPRPPRRCSPRPDMIVKVKEPQPQRMGAAARRPDPLHLSPPRARSGADQGPDASGVTAIAYETVTDDAAACRCWRRCRRSPAACRSRPARPRCRRPMAAAACCSAACPACCPARSPSRRRRRRPACGEDGGRPRRRRHHHRPLAPAPAPARRHLQRPRPHPLFDRRGDRGGVSSRPTSSSARC